MATPYVRQFAAFGIDLPLPPDTSSTHLGSLKPSSMVVLVAATWQQRVPMQADSYLGPAISIARGGSTISYPGIRSYIRRLSNGRHGKPSDVDYLIRVRCVEYRV